MKTHSRGGSKHVLQVQGSKQKTIDVPLNDDSEEKRKRLAERSARQGHERSLIAAAASPRKVSAAVVAAGQQQHPRSSPMSGRVSAVENVGNVRKIPLLANFEEWMKMATDNKINATNSWNFALIDYFHDMSLLRDGDSINFQKASCTLDGCVKIYTSRVDSVATETGKLLSGLADGESEKRKKGGQGNGNDDDDDERAEDEEGEEEDEEGEKKGQKKTKRRVQRTEATLAKDFASIQLKKLELDFSIDPLFKKITADFDEGGAKGLLLNRLNLDESGRIIFDAREESAADGSAPETAEPKPSFIDISTLRDKYFPSLSSLDQEDICPSLKHYEFSHDAALNLPFLNMNSVSDSEEGQRPMNDGRVQDYDTQFDRMEDYGGEFGNDGGSHEEEDASAFGQGGERWAADSREAGTSASPVTALEPLKDLKGQDLAMALASGNEESLLSYFDKALKKNWAGPEHWRIEKIKRDASTSTEPKKVRKEKEKFEIDFFSHNPIDEDTLFGPGGASISLPRSQWKSPTRNLLPDDIHFNSVQLLRLFLKPNILLHRRVAKASAVSKDTLQEINSYDMDEQFWAQTNQEAAQQNDGSGEEPRLTYDAAFFDDADDDGFCPDIPDDDDFEDAQEHFAPDSGISPTQKSPSAEAKTANDISVDLLEQRRARPDYINYAKRAKRVDVKLLKDNIWTELDFTAPTITEAADRADDSPRRQSMAPRRPSMEVAEEGKKFTTVLKGLRKVYPEKAMNDISVSMAFIALLHICNEEGLQLNSTDNLHDLYITNDMTVDRAAVESY